jgi:autotransporter family porin
MQHLISERNRCWSTILRGLFLATLTTCIACTFAVQAQTLNVIYVNSGASGGDGSSWSEAYKDLQAALAIAAAGDEVWVAAGIYYPTSGQDREVSFQMVERVAIYGGFSGGENSLDQQDWEKNRTVLSGNIGARDDKTDNSLTVVKGADNAIIDGFVIEDGYAMAQKGSWIPEHITPEVVLNASSGAGSGGGMFNHGAAPIVRNTVIQNNEAGKGGGVYNMSLSRQRAAGVNRQPIFINVTIKDNVAFIRGGGMSNDLGTHPIIINSTFIGNSNIAKGGAMYNDFGCSPIIINTSFVENTAMRASAIGNDGHSSPILVNVDISGNIALDQGAALYQGSYNANRSAGANHPIVINSRITGNRSETNGSATILNWGEDWITSIDSEIDDWPYSAPKDEAGKYKSLVELATVVEDLSASEISSEQISELLTLVPTAGFGAPPGERPGPSGSPGQFGVDRELLTEVQIADQIFYVDARISARERDGRSWKTAFVTVQEAIDAAHKMEGGQVWVASGTYYPTETENRSASFVMKEGVGIYGGFSGDEQVLGDRDWAVNETVLSGDIGVRGVNTDNVYHVVLGSIHSVLDGFVVRDGYADGVIKNSYGGGMFNWGYQASAIVRNTEFTANHAADGGGIFNFGDVLAYFDSVNVHGNRSLTGGGITMRFGSSIRVDNSRIADNFAEYRGGGAVINYGSNAEFNNVTFSGNRTNGNGGGVWVDDQASQYGGTRPVFRRSRFENNQAGFIGGGIHNFNAASTVMERNTFVDNRADIGSNIANTLSSRVTMRENTVDPETVYTDDGSSMNAPR